MTRDPAREYDAQELLRLTQNLARLATAVHSGVYRERALTLDFVQELHAGLFEGVRDHAGRIRQRGFGQEHLIFGPNRSVHRDRVREELEVVFAEARRRLSDLLRDREADDFDLVAIELAVVTHARIVGIHPFEDGNGRTSRLVMGHLLVAAGLLPIPVETCKQEYTEILNGYFATRDSTDLVGLFLRLYPLGAESR